MADSCSLAAAIGSAIVLDKNSQFTYNFQSMEIRLDSVEDAEKEVILTAERDEIDVNLDLAKVCSDIELRLKHRRVDDEIFFDGTLRFQLEVTCVRCLEQSVTSHTVPLKLILQLLPDEKLADVEDCDDHFIMIPASDWAFCFDDKVRELIILELPLKPLCSTECRGICSGCGTNLNESDCDCNQKENDPRWDDLRKLTGN